MSLVVGRREYLKPVSELTRTGLIRLWVGILVLCGGSQAIAAPSVGCAAARGSVARAICADPKLSRLNREVRGFYRKALLTGDRASLTAAQWSWVVQRNRTCAKKPGAEMAACVAQSQNARILELRNLLEAGSAATSEKVPVASPPQPPVTPPKQNADCTNAIGVIDRAICNDATLRHWEDRLGKLYQQALGDPLFRTVVVDDQQRWIGERTGSCEALSSTKMTDCVLQLTKRRIEQLVHLINSRDDAQDRTSKVTKILSGKTVPPPGLDADTIDRESARADQSELIIGDARTCIRKNFGAAAGVAESDAKQVVALMSEICFADFSKKLSALELGALAKPSFEMLVQQELRASK
jgi:uncharacterized protein